MKIGQAHLAPGMCLTKYNQILDSVFTKYAVITQNQLEQQAKERMARGVKKEDCRVKWGWDLVPQEAMAELISLINEEVNKAKM